MRIAIITGASAGMGWEAAKQIDAKFKAIDEIWLIARRMDRLRELESQLQKKARCFALDLTDHASFELFQNELQQCKPDVKMLINSAGYGKIGKVGEVPYSKETGMVELNCEAVVGMTSIVLPYMTKNSRIIQFASAAAFAPEPSFCIYAATKAFVLSYSRALNEELKPRKIYVTAVCPGPVDTEFFDVAEETGGISLLKKLVKADPKKVVELAIEDSRHGRAMSVYGPLVKLFYVLSKILPHSILMKFTKK